MYSIINVSRRVLNESTVTKFNDFGDSLYIQSIWNSLMQTTNIHKTDNVRIYSAIQSVHSIYMCIPPHEYFREAPYI